MKFKNILVFICYSSVLCIDSVVSIGTEVKTSSGLVRGKTIRVFNQSLNQFLGIPFAEPPVGSLRFAKPKAIHKPIEGVIDATKPKTSCMQNRMEFFPVNAKLTYSEDCLLLNIWSAQPTNKESSKLKPVMFWIYGGGLRAGLIYEIPPYNGSVLATNDVVFVSANYRLGIFGFLYGGTKDSPGNLGFYDQQLALKWVRDNIHLFGGDKNQITIFGESAGSWSVSAQILSPLSRGLFKRAILESGADFHNKKRSLLTTSEAIKQSKDMAKHFNCSEDHNWLDCLREVDAHSFLNYTGITTYPLDGTEFLPDFAQNTFKHNHYSQDIDIIAGVNRDEGSLLGAHNLEALKGNITEKQFKELVSVSDGIFHDLSVENVMDFYLKGVDRSNTSALRKAFFDFYGDILMKCPTYLFAKQFSQNNPKRKVYFYELTYQSKTYVLHGCEESNMGICHGSDLQFVFGYHLLNQNMSTKLDLDFSRQIIQMWTNFAKTGDPGSNWPPMIGHDSIVVRNLNAHIFNGVYVDPYKKDCDDFWKNYF